MASCRQPRRKIRGFDAPLRRPTAEARETPSFEDCAPLENLQFIRRTMESAGSFTAVPGRGMMVVGLTALVASALLAVFRPASYLVWLMVWLSEALLAAGISIFAMVRKAGQEALVASVPARKCLLSFLPPMLAGIVLSLGMILGGIQSHAVYAGLWLLIYGTAVMTGGAFSVRIVPVMGLCFSGFGVVVLFLPSIWGDVAMACGFGGMHVVFGALIARHYGG